MTDFGTSGQILVPCYRILDPRGWLFTSKWPVLGPQKQPTNVYRNGLRPNISFCLCWSHFSSISGWNRHPLGSDFGPQFSSSRSLFQPKPVPKKYPTKVYKTRTTFVHISFGEKDIIFTSKTPSSKARKSAKKSSKSCNKTCTHLCTDI